MERYCEQYRTLEEARLSCQCSCSERTHHEYTFYECAYGNCCGSHCEVCGKFEVVNRKQEEGNA